MLTETAEMAAPGHWGCSHCDVNNDAENFRSSCKHILCGQCIIGVINRNKLLNIKSPERNASASQSSVIEVTCPCPRCRGTLQVSRCWYDDMNARVISLDVEDGQEVNYSTASVAQVKTEFEAKAAVAAQVKSEIKAETTVDVDPTVVAKGIERGGLKPLFEKGDKVYAPWEETGTWYSGKVLHYEQFDSKSRYGDVRKYVIKFDDGDVGSTDDFNVFLPEDYLLCLADKDKGKWKGVKNVRDKGSSDKWAKFVGWYEAKIDGKSQKFSTLVGALRAYDASVIKKKRSETKESDLNLPEEYRNSSPNKRGSGVDVEAVTPSPMASFSSICSEDDNESRFSEQDIEQGRTKRIKVDNDTKICLPPQLEETQHDDKFWSAGSSDVEFTKEAFKRKSIFHLNSFVDGKKKRNEGFGTFVEHGIATPYFDQIPENIDAAVISQNELREALIKDKSWMHWYEDTKPSGAAQTAMWYKRVEVGSFIVMRHEYGNCRYCPNWLKERDEETGRLEYIGPVYIIGVVTRKLKPHSVEEQYVNSEIKSCTHDVWYNVCLVDWKRMGFKCDLKEETRKYINRICQPTVANICKDFEKVYMDGATAESLRQDLWDNSSPFELDAQGS